MAHSSIIAKIDELVVLINSVALVDNANVDNMASTSQIAYDESVFLRMRDAARERELIFHNNVYSEFKSGNFDQGMDLIQSGHVNIPFTRMTLSQQYYNQRLNAGGIMNALQFELHGNIICICGCEYRDHCTCVKTAMNNPYLADPSQFIPQTDIGRAYMESERALRLGYENANINNTAIRPIIDFSKLNDMD